jgi:adenylate kinase family enzyme
MSNSVLILGESGCGKSTSIRNLPSEETLIINVISKPLPFRGASKKYTKLSPDGLTGNYYASDDHSAIMRIINLVNTKRTDIKYLVIDDYGYTITNSFMRKATQRGYDKFVEIGLDSFTILDKITSLRDDLFCFVMMHTEIDSQGKYKPKTVGKMIDQYVNIEGKFTYVFHALVTESGYQFITNNDSKHMAKTPMGSFDELYIENDLLIVTEKIKDYLNE